MILIYCSFATEINFGDSRDFGIDTIRDKSTRHERECRYRDAAAESISSYAIWHSE